MSIQIFESKEAPVRVFLSRRNLETLLKKLDNKRSAKTIIKHDTENEHYPQSHAVVYVTAVEDDAYYHDRDPGVVAEDLEDV